MRHQRHSQSRDEGFTLIEILIVIVILGILAAVVVFAVQSLGTASAKTACNADLKIVGNSTEVYKAQVGHYPHVGDNAAATPGGTQISGGLTAASDGIQALFTVQPYQGVVGGQAGPWLKNVPINGNHYQITLKSDGSGIVQISDAAGVGQFSCSGVQ